MATGRRRYAHIAFAATVCVVLWLGWNYDAYIGPSTHSQWSPGSSIPNGASKQGGEHEAALPPASGDFIWRAVEEHYPATSFRPLPTGKPKRLPAVQAKFPSEAAKAAATRLQRQEAVKDAFLRCWNAYKEYAWLRDEVTPVSGKYKDSFGGWGATLVDSLDTLWIMNFKEEFSIAVDALYSNITFETTELSEISVFETSIRFLGGLLSAYDLSNDIRLLSKARDVGDMLYKAFDTPTRIPIPRWKIHAAAHGENQTAPDSLLLAELGSLTMEFTRLSLLTKDPKYYEAVARLSDLLEQTQMKTKVPGLWPTKVGTTAETLDTGREYTLGAEADSTYEYTSKMMALLGGQLPMYEAMYSRSMDAASKYLFYRPLSPKNEDILISGTVRSNGDGEPSLETSAQHLSCFAGGMLALGGRLTSNKEHIELARKLTHGCVWLYHSAPNGIMSEACRIAACPEPASSCNWKKHVGVWHKAVTDKHGTARPAEEIIAEKRLPPGWTEIQAPYYLLRPEAIESIFILYRVTADTALMDRAWEMWTAINNVTQTDLANSALWDINPEPGQAPPMSDSMESFWMSETLKYFYLIFSEPGLISLDEWVFNTEAHPFRRMLP